MINNEQKIYSYIGLAMRAGKVVSGDDTTLKELKKGKLSFGKQNLEAGTINQIYFSTKVELGLAIGKAPRAVIGIKDKALSQKIIELVQSKNS